MQKEGKSFLMFSIVLLAVGAALGMALYDYYLCKPCNEGRVMIDGKQWHRQRDSLMQIIEHKDAVNLLLAEKAVADSLRKAKEDSVAGVLATIRLERIARHDYRRFHDRDLDSVLNARYGWVRE